VSVLCHLFGVARSTTYYQPRGRHLEPQCDPVCVEAIRAVIEAHPTYGVRMTHARLTKGQGMIVNRKKVHRIMRLHRWTCRQRRTGRRPRVQHLKSIAAAPNQRWATDIATVDCGHDGWCAFVPVVDCCSREVLGWELAHTARAKTAERALEEALLHRFGTTCGAPSGLTLRHDNGLVFGSRAYRALVRDYGLTQEYIAPYTPEQNGLCERFIRTFKEECAWQHRFDNLAAARATVARYIEHYNTQRTHSALKYNTPRQTYLTLCNLPHQQAA
jgi:putative transposase